MNAITRLEQQPDPQRPALPDWPRLMSIDLAAGYLGLGISTIRSHGPKPKRWGSRVLYDRRDLDRWADALDGQPLDENQRTGEADDALKRIQERLDHARK